LTDQKLPAAFTECDGGGGHVFIVVGEIISPGQFYWFLKQSKEEIEKLSERMT